MNLAELISMVRSSGAGHPLDAVEIGSSPEPGECAAGCGLPCTMRIDGLRLHMKCFFDSLASPAPHPNEVPGSPTAKASEAKPRPRGPLDEADPRVPVPEEASEAKPPPGGSEGVPAKAGVLNVRDQAPQRSGGSPGDNKRAPGDEGANFRRADPRAKRAGSPSENFARNRPKNPAAVLDHRGLWLPGAPDPVAAEPPGDIEAVYHLASKHSLRQLWVHPSMHDRLDIPVKRELTLAPTEGVEHPFTAPESMVCDPGGLAAWVNVKPATGADRRIAVVFPAFETRCDWRSAADGPELLAAVLALGAELGENYYLSPNETGKALVRRTASSDPTVLGEADMPEPAGDLVHPHLWARHLLDEEDDDSAWVHRYDLNGAQPSVFGAIYVATGAFDHVPDADFELARDKNRAGYWLVNIPREAHGLDPRLPDLLKPLRQLDERGRSQGEPAWFCTDSLVLLAERGVPLTVHEAYIADSSVRLLRKTNDRYRAARTALLAARDAEAPGAALAYSVLKAVFTSRIGDFAHEGARIYRPDIRDAIIARAAANQYRRLRTIAVGKDSAPDDHGTGRFPLAIYEDAVYYVSPEQDAVTGAPAGLPMGSELGQYSHEASLPLSVVREHTGTRNFHRSFTRALRGAMKGGR